MKSIVILMFVFILGFADLKQNQWYSCISSDDKGEIFIKKVSSVHIIGDDIDLWYSKSKDLYTGINGFGDIIVLGLVPNEQAVVFGTNTIPPEVWKCEKIYGKVPYLERK